MKRLTVCLISCLVLAGSGWLGHAVWAQSDEAAKEKKFTITQGQLDKYVAEQVGKAVAAEREKSGGVPAQRVGGAVSDEQVLKGENWHYAVYHQTAFVVYTGPGQAMFHHYVAPKEPPAKSGAPAPATPPAKGN
jgi:hypothetical protein